MAKLTILEFPDPRLRTTAVPVEVVDDELNAVIDDMLETMYAAPGIGLAATQVDIHKRFLVADVSHDQSEPQVFINQYYQFRPVKFALTFSFRFMPRLVLPPCCATLSST